MFHTGAIMAQPSGVKTKTIMCDRYVSPDEASNEREFNLVYTEWQFPPSFNVAPTLARAP
jgi:hypothetical protein